MDNANFSHFGVKDEDQQHYRQRVVPTNQAKIDGYHFGDRLLEGVMFIATIQEDGSIVMSVEERSQPYFNQLNTQMWLDKALEEVMTGDVFESDGQDVCLVMDDGRYNYEWDNDVTK